MTVTATLRRLDAELGDLIERHGRGRSLEEFAAYSNDPIGFIREVLGGEPWSRQVEIAEAVRDELLVAVRSANAVGKDWIAARLALWWVYARTWDSARGLWRKRSLGHRDRPRAKAFAHELYARLVQGEENRQAGRVTLSEVFALYRRHKTPTKSPAHQREDRRKVDLWTRFLGPKKDPHDVSLSEWERFKRARSEGAIDARGRHVLPKKRRKVGARVLEIDCGWLSAVFRWGTVWRLPDGRYLMRQNAVRGYPIPREKNPKRPVVTEERYRKMLAAADKVTVRVSWNGRRETVRAPFREALILTNELGRRYGAILALRYSDVVPDRGPHGSVRFRADSDKMGVESVVPMSREARRAIDHILRDRPGVGSLPLFPSPRDPSKPVSRHLASKWFRECEDEAKLEHVKGLGWHGLRRKFATEMSHVPDRLVARLGGWKNPRTLDLYSQPTGTMLAEALEQRRELREVADDDGGLAGT